MPKIRRIKVKREWGKTVEDDITKFHILAWGMSEIMARKFARKVLKRKKLPSITHYGKLTKSYRTWLRKKKREKYRFTKARRKALSKARRIRRI